MITLNFYRRSFSKFHFLPFQWKTADFELLKTRNLHVAKMVLINKFDEVSTLKLFDVFHLPILRKINCLKRLDEYGVGQIENLLQSLG